MKVTSISFLTANDVMEILGCKRAKAYKIIKSLNDELEEMGYLVMGGKVSQKYFEKRYYGNNEEG